jgi:uncharacterized SAM-binding protein YcdF (DUF218 family)
MDKPITHEKGRRLFRFVMIICFIGIVVLMVSFGKIMGAVGQWLVLDQKPVHSDAVVILNTGIGWYPRVMAAAVLYRKGFVNKVVVNGNRKTDTLRQLEDMGFKRCCPWYEDGVRILELLGVPREAVITVSAEDAYDTVTEAKAVGCVLKEAGVSSIIVTTSKYHTRRSHHIWKNTYPNQFRICTVAAHDDPFTPKGWWKEGRQIRWVMAEYGAWVYYFWKQLGNIQ